MKPIWMREYFGDAHLVHGIVWPHLEVEQRKYRFRFPDGSNAHFYDLYFGEKPARVYRIGTDGGCLSAPVQVSDIFLAPGERANTIVGFSTLEMVEMVILYSTAPGPYLGGDLSDPETIGHVMQFGVVESKGKDKSTLPTTLVDFPGCRSQERCPARP
jgi:spore coat protein A